MNPPGSGNIILQDPHTVKRRKDTLISTVLEEISDDRLTTGYSIAQEMLETDFNQLKKGMASQFFVKKALENKFRTQIAKYGSSLLVADKKKQSEEDASPTRASPFVEGGLLDFIVMPSVSDLKQVVRDRGGQTLKEIKSVTVEKLTNKIIRSFALDIAFIVPFLLFIGIQYRKAAEQIFAGDSCFSGVSNWLLTYFLFMTAFAAVKLVRVCVLRTVPHQYYFYYVLFTTGLYWVAMFGWFIAGNFIFFAALSSSDCPIIDEVSNPAEKFNAIPLLTLMGVILVIHWFMLLAVYQISFFTFMLWALWRGVVRAAQKMQDKFSVRRLLELVIEAIGEGELQDSLLIGTIQFLLTDQNYRCKICKMPFTEEDSSPVSPDDEGNSHSQSDVVQLGCNPTHVFHSQCLQWWPCCPECLVPIERNEKGQISGSASMNSRNMKED